MKRGRDAPPAPEAVATDRRLAAAAYALLPVINGYAEIFSVFAGETVGIRAARKVVAGSNADAEIPCGAIVRIEVRNAATGEVLPVGGTVRIPIFAQLPCDFKEAGADYSCRLSLDTTGWPPAFYECILHDDAGNRSQDIHFNVKPHSYDGYDLACVLPTFTWQAYNRIGGGCFYNTDAKRRMSVSTRRPISRKLDNSSTGALPFLALFAEAGVSYCCVDSSDLHHGLCPGGAAPVMALLTHDEYWTDEMRAAIERFLAAAGTLMVLAGNVCWWRIKVRGTDLVVNKDPTAPRGQRWFARGMPEETTFVSSFRFGGYPLERAKRKARLAAFAAALPEEVARDCAAMRVTAPEHPLFEGVEFAPGNLFGGEVPIMYREIDGVPLDDDGNVDRERYRADDVAPRVLATGLTIGGRKVAKVRKVGVIVEAAVRGGHVLHMGSFGWSLGLTQGNETVKRIVLNAYEYCRSIRRTPKNANREMA